MLMDRGLGGAICSSVEEDVRSYLAEIMSRLAEIMSRFGSVTEPDAPAESRESLTEEIFSVLTSRPFSHLSRADTAPYRSQTVALLEERVRGGEPIPFWYDIGPGYHASIRPGQGDLSFDVGLAELFVLLQITSFCDRVARIYAPGARFWLVVDNLCALRTNDIPVERTAAYSAGFRRLIRELGLEHRVGVIVESEEFDLGEYDRILAELEPQPLAAPPSGDEVENVERFLGRHCSAEEAADRIDGYRRAAIVTEQLLARVVRGVRMTQRATSATLGFRAFPGGDSRTQCGEVAVSRTAKGKLYPVLLTSRNLASYHVTPVRCPEEFPSMISKVTYAEKRPHDRLHRRQ